MHLKTSGQSLVISPALWMVVRARSQSFGNETSQLCMVKHVRTLVKHVPWSSTYPGQARTVPWSSTHGTLVKHVRTLVKHVAWSSTYPGQACTLVKHVPWSSMYTGQAHTLGKHTPWSSMYTGQAEREREGQRALDCM